MCIILDVDSLDLFNNRQNADMEPVRKWFGRKNNKFVYSPTKKFEQEWGKNSIKRHKLIQSWRQAGKLKQVDAKRVEQEAEKLEEKRQLKSNDYHIIALARIAKTESVDFKR